MINDTAELRGYSDKIKLHHDNFIIIIVGVGRNL